MPGLLSRRATSAAVPGIRQAGLRGAGTYLDGATDDARLTLAVVASALEAGALALSRMEVEQIEHSGSGVELGARDTLSGERHQLRAQTLVLAGGALSDPLRSRAGLEGDWVQPTRGSHILVPRERLAADGAVIFPSAVDGRIVFLIPWPDRTIIGTTDLDAPPTHEVLASHAEVRYLLDTANALVPSACLEEADVISSWAGLRPLLRAREHAPSARSREERVEREGRVYTIAGGKLTAYRSMVERLAARITAEQGFGDPSKRSATRDHPLRGASTTRSGRPVWSRLDESGRPRAGADRLAETWSRRYAGLAGAVRALCDGVAGGDRPLAADTLLGEVDWAARYEDCLCAEDFLMRRTDLGRSRPDEARAGLPLVLERLAGIHGWDAERRRAEGEAAERALQQGASWRAEGPRKSA
jgi:glycerol-3-phosphate dehydrogenase